MKSLDRELTKFFVEQAARHRRAYLLAFALVPLVAIVSAFGPKVFQLAIDGGIAVGDGGALTFYALIYLALMVAGLLLDPIQQVLLMGAGIRTLREIRETVVGHISRLGRATFEKQPLGVFVARATSDVDTIGETLASGLVSIVTDVFRIAAVLILLTLQNWRLGLLTALLVPLIGFLINWFRIRVRVLQTEIRTRTGRLAGVLNETVNMRKEVLAFHLGETITSRFRGENAALRKANVLSISYDACTYSVIEGLSHITVGLILLLVAQAWLLDDVLTVGEVAMYIMYLQQLFTPFKQLGQRFTVLQAAYAALQKLHNTLSLPLPDDSGEEVPAQGDLRVNRVHFAYNADNEVLRGISLRVPARGSLAIVGPTGSGKTTIIRLLTRQYEPTAGSISLADRPLASIGRDALKRSVVLVPQEPVIVRGTVWENIALGKKGCTRAQVEAAAREIGTLDTLQALAAGLDTAIRSEGLNLSMGQRQLIALTRAFVADANVLIFDESTANIDTLTELAIQRALDVVMHRRSTIIIAHRLSTIRDAERIVVLREGRIAEEGTHAELLGRHGLYRRMYDLQSFDRNGERVDP